MKTNVKLLGSADRSGDPDVPREHPPAQRHRRFGGPDVSALLKALIRIEVKLDRVQQELTALKNDGNEPEFITVSEAARILRRSPYTIRRWLREGELDGSKTTSGSKGQYLIRRTEVDSLLRQGRHYG